MQRLHFLTSLFALLNATLHARISELRVDTEPWRRVRISTELVG